MNAVLRPAVLLACAIMPALTSSCGEMERQKNLKQEYAENEAGIQEAILRMIQSGDVQSVDSVVARYYCVEDSVLDVVRDYIEVIKENKRNDGLVIDDESELKRFFVKAFYGINSENISWPDGKKARLANVKPYRMSTDLTHGFGIEAHIRAEDLMTTGAIRRGFISDIMDIIKICSTKPQTKRVAIVLVFVQFPMMDNYGNSAESLVCKVFLDRGAMEKINWDATTPEMFIQVLKADGNFWIHPAFTKE